VWTLRPPFGSWAHSVRPVGIRYSRGDPGRGDRTPPAVSHAVRTSQNTPSTLTQSRRIARPVRRASADMSRRWHRWSGREPPGTSRSQSPSRAVTAEPPDRTHSRRSARLAGARFIRSASANAMRNIATLPASRANRFEAAPLWAYSVTAVAAAVYSSRFGLDIPCVSSVSIGNPLGVVGALPCAPSRVPGALGPGPIGGASHLGARSPRPASAAMARCPGAASMSRTVMTPSPNVNPPSHPFGIDPGSDTSSTRVDLRHYPFPIYIKIFCCFGLAFP